MIEEQVFVVVCGTRGRDVEDVRNFNFGNMHVVTSRSLLGNQVETPQGSWTYEYWGGEHINCTDPHNSGKYHQGNGYR